MVFKPASMSVIWQMRFAMLAAGLLVLVLLGTAAMGLSRIQSAQTTLTDHAVPGLASVEILDRELGRLADAVTALRDAKSPSEHDTALNQARQASGALGSTRPAEETFRALLTQHSGVVEEISLTARSMLENRAQMERATEDHVARVNAIRAQIDRFSLETAANTEFQALSNPADVSAERLLEAATALKTLSDLQQQLEETAEHTLLLGEVESDELIAEFTARIRFSERAAIRLLTRLPRGLERTALVRDIRDARVGFHADDGPIQTQQRYVALRQRADAAFERHNQQISGIFDTARAEIAASKAEMQETVRAVGDAVGDTAFRLQIVAVMALGLLATIAFFTVERRIIRRLAVLSDSVKRIAGGDIEHPVSVQGQDELAEMSRALETFKDNSRELRRSNSDLERFAYAASHDLRSPLRAIRDLAEWTLEDAGDDLSPDCRENLHMLLSRAERLSKLLGNLLDYSRAGAEEASIEVVDMQEVIDDCVELVGVGDRFSVSVTGDGAITETFATPLRQILLNLVSNAVKHHDVGAGHLDVRCTRADGRLTIAFSDDGPGIPEEYQLHVFDMFKMLKSRDDVEGSGMGLAIIRKIVERYGGSIRIDSDPTTRRGTTFLFDWPECAAAAPTRRAA